MKFTPDNIIDLAKNEVFVFGSNESGIHGAGAARLANKKFGAIMEQGFGLQGRSFAIPSKDWNINTLPINIIKFYVGRFLDFAKNNSNSTFFVTKIGCGLAGHSVMDIAPLFFQNGEPPENVILPEDFWKAFEQFENTNNSFYN